MLMYILDSENHAVRCDDLMAWSQWMENGGIGLRRVAVTEFEGVEVSTVFLGLDHGLTHHGDPLLWQTMIFGGPRNGWQERYTSHADAVRGHARAVELATNNEAEAS